MAIGRVNETTLQVFGDDYPTPYANFFFCALFLPTLPQFFASIVEYQIDSRVFVFHIVMGHVCVIIYTCLILRLAISSRSTRSHPARTRLTIARRLRGSKHITSAAGRASACYKSLRPCAPRPDSIIDITLSAVGALRPQCRFKKSQLTITLIYDVTRRGDVPDLTADPTLAEKELGFRAKKDLTTMCRDLWNWQTKNPRGYGTD
jgi:hypothetical protein